MRRASVLGMLCLAVACGRRAPAPALATVDASAPIVPVSVAPTGASAAPAGLHHQTAFASFVGDVLDECTDVVIDFSSTVDAGAVKALTNGLAKTATEIGQRCADQFPDRTILALCTMEQKGDAGALLIVSAYYNFATVGLSDTFMNQCLKSKGKWKGLDRNSDDWRRAKLDHDLQEARRLIKQ